MSGEPGIGKSRLTAALSGAARDGAAHPSALFLLAASSRTARSIPSSPSSSAPPGSRATTRRGSKLGKAAGIARPGHAGCRRYRAVERAAVVAECRRRRSTSARSANAEKLFEAMLSQLEAEARQPAGADGVRGRPLDRSDLARIAGSDRRPGAASAGAAGDHLPPRISAALGRPRPCQQFGAQSARRTRRRGAGADSGRQCGACAARSSRRSSSAPTACRCLSRS